MDYRDLGFSSFLTKTLSNMRRPTPQEARNAAQFGPVTASSVYVGSEDNVFKADQNGIYLGNAVFADAPFNVDMSGNATLTSANITATRTTVTPGADAASTFRVTKADGTQVFDVDTTNGWVNIGPDQPTYDEDPLTSLYVTKDTDSYHALNIINTNGGEFASSDIVAVNNTSNPFVGWVDLGVNGTGWNDPDYATFDAGAGYCWAVSGNMYFGSGLVGGSVFFFTGGVDSKNYIRAEINSDGVFLPFQAPTASAPTYVEGGIYYDTTTHKLTIGGAAGWETITSS